MGAERERERWERGIERGRDRGGRGPMRKRTERASAIMNVLNMHDCVFNQADGTQGMLREHYRVLSFI